MILLRVAYQANVLVSEASDYHSPFRFPSSYNNSLPLPPTILHYSTTYLLASILYYYFLSLPPTVFHCSTTYLLALILYRKLSLRFHLLSLVSLLKSLKPRDTSPGLIDQILDHRFRFNSLRNPTCLSSGPLRSTKL